MCKTLTFISDFKIRILTTEPQIDSENVLNIPATLIYGDQFSNQKLVSNMASNNDPDRLSASQLSSRNPVWDIKIVRNTLELHLPATFPAVPLRQFITVSSLLHDGLLPAAEGLQRSS
ncbi:hypothetical protein CHARACLAT_027827 [Characodon lateralis]|uniref:Uncharacterized protein n=1 Tax=Characodon lateralis TaxID=208331 RepID=A0ABU7DKH7_9TELE|nr:hypothetical protein [Characodon lateralis]